jgi:hypothetical protein
MALGTSQRMSYHVGITNRWPQPTIQPPAANFSRRHIELSNGCGKTSDVTY